MDLKKHNDEAASKVAAVMQRAEEQGRMIESLHTSVSLQRCAVSIIIFLLLAEENTSFFFSV